MAFDATKIKVVNRNDLTINPATEDTQLEVKDILQDLSISGIGGGIPANKATDAFSYAVTSETVTHTYYFFEDGNGNWYIRRKDKTTGVHDFSKGIGGYESVFVNNTSAPSGSPTWGTYDETFTNVGASSLEFDVDGNLKVTLDKSKDSVSDAIMIVDYAHHEIHSGSHYMYTDCLTMGNAATQDYLFTTPNTTKWSHLSFSFSGSAITGLDVYEGADRTGTTLQTIFNNNRNSANTSGNTIYKDTSGGTTNGTKIWCFKSGAATGASVNAGASSSQDNEIILKQNTKYIFRLTSGTASNLVNLVLGWYEHTNI